MQMMRAQKTYMLGASFFNVLFIYMVTTLPSKQFGKLTKLFSNECEAWDVSELVAFSSEESRYFPALVGKKTFMLIALLISREYPYLKPKKFYLSLSLPLPFSSQTENELLFTTFFAGECAAGISIWTVGKKSTLHFRGGGEGK